MQAAPEQKTCSICKQLLPLDDFVSAKNKPDGKHSQCKSCNRKRLADWRLRNLEKRRDYERRWDKRNAESRRLKSRRYNERNKQLNSASPPPAPTIKRCSVCGIEKPGVEFYRTAAAKDGFSCRCKDCASKDQTEWRQQNPEMAKARDRESWVRYKPKYQANYKTWIASNRSGRNRYRRELHAKNMLDNPNYKWAHKIRRKISLAMSGLRKSSPTEKLLGCSFQELRTHLESLWLPGMSWENYGMYGWHIDHKRPVDSFDLSRPEDQRACFRHTNLQPLWAKDNISKSNKLT